MNNLITTDIKMTSLDIAEVTGKRHADVMRDVRKEIDELGKEIGQRIFAPTERTDSQNRKQPIFEFGREGAMQLALKYDAKTRYKVIKRIEELENRPVSQLEIMQMQVQKLVEHERKLNETEKRIEVVENNHKEFKEIFSIDKFNWREEVNKITNKIAKENGGIYQQLRNKTYTDLEVRARVDLNRRLENMKRRAEKAGAGKKELTNMNYLDVIDRDEKLIEIYLTIIKEIAIKYGVEVAGDLIDYQP